MCDCSLLLCAFFLIIIVIYAVYTCENSGKRHHHLCPENFILVEFLSQLSCSFPLVSLGQTCVHHFLKLNLPFPLLHTNSSPAFVAVSVKGATLYQVAIAMRSHPWLPPSTSIYNQSLNKMVPIFHFWSIYFCLFSLAGMLISSQLPRFPRKHHLTFELLGLYLPSWLFWPVSLPSRLILVLTKEESLSSSHSPSPSVLFLHLLPSGTLTAPGPPLVTHSTLCIVIAYLILLSPETRVRSLGQEVPLEKEMATHSSVLAWRIPWAEEPGGPQSMGLQELDMT